MSAPKSLARIAGFLYLVSSVMFVFAVYLRRHIIQPGDPAVTAENIRASAQLFRVAFVLDLISGTLFLLMVIALYLLFKRIHEPAAVTMLTLVAVMTAVAYLNDLNQFAALTVATDSSYTKAFGQSGSNALVLLFTHLQSGGFAIDELFWGLWLLPLAYLVIRSRYVPALLGALLIVAGGTWIAQFVTYFLEPNLETIASGYGFAGLGELIFAAWLLTLAVRIPPSEISAPALAPLE